MILENGELESSVWVSWRKVFISVGAVGTDLFQLSPSCAVSRTSLTRLTPGKWMGTDVIDACLSLIERYEKPLEGGMLFLSARAIGQAAGQRLTKPDSST
ncbi:hypothetical protein CEUSTIGMA_g12746.t1 [Chlamydomonas eustigma]|uniref:Uncharacterized protein n=1 Tax=Chlamydomonas eustigma TaxID=1157962 RepID=A0A250XQU8_9CHLO|nr:hypothetical protein CEUSTIGMA_g12746.t1 [Chlamydomonas eustigma]|eukprot:GAX85329.1 hypothetical protein CEUSTIGMA_g12746.t1 [Chlamydomonas eustigma]